MIAGLLAKARGSRVVHGSAWILVGLAAQAVLGFVFWFLGARVATSAELGRASALFTAIQFVNFVAGLGLTVALARHAVSRTEESDALFGWALGAAVLASCAGGLTYLAIVDTPATQLVTGSPAERAVFCAYVAGIAVGLLADVRLMAARRWRWLVGRYAIVGLLRLPLVLVDVGVSPDRWLFHLMLGPLAVAGVAMVAGLPLIGAGSVRWRRPVTLAPVARYAGVNWAATLASQAPQYVLPLVVANSVASSVNASFFLAWTVTGMVMLAPAAISQVLLVEGSHDPAADAAQGAAAEGDAGRRSRDALRFSLGLAIVAFVGGLVGGQVAALAFGDGYDRLALFLPGLLVAGIPWAYTSVQLSEARLRRDQRTTIAITATLGLVVLLPALLLVPGRGAGAAIGSWIVGNVAAAAVAALAARRRSASQPPDAPAPLDAARS
jgi:O-antigen/teichoic acid export membrane protein